jgi:hypothetical protein
MSDVYIPTSMYQLFKIDGDGACLYHCFSQYLSFKDQSFWHRVELFLSNQQVPFPIHMGETVDDLFRFFQDSSIPQDVKSAWLQKVITEWTYQHRKDLCLFPVTESMIELQDYVLSVCQGDSVTPITTMEQYYEVYSEYTGIRNKHWGGANDIEVFAYLFHVPVELYQLYRPNRNQVKERCGLHFYRNGFLKLSGYFKPFELDEETKRMYFGGIPEEDPMTLLYGGQKKDSLNHYSLLMKK